MIRLTFTGNFSVAYKLECVGERSLLTNCKKIGIKRVCVWVLLNKKRFILYRRVEMLDKNTRNGEIA